MVHVLVLCLKIVNVYYMSSLWSFKSGYTKLERFLPKNQLYINEIIEFLELV